MKEIALVYNTKYGSTKRYADWIAADCKADLVAFEDADIDRLAEYATVIYGAPVYKGVIQGIEFIRKNLDELSGCRVLVFTVGLTAPGDEVAFQQVLDRNFTEEEQKRLEFYHFMGAIDFKKLTFGQRSTLRLLKRFIQKKPANARSEVEKYFLEGYGGKLDFVNYAYVKPFVKLVQNR